MKKMLSYDSKSKFSVFTKPAYYLRVDDSHPLDLLIGLNDYGQKTIRLIGNYTKKMIKGTKTIEVNHYIHTGKLVLSFSLTNPDYLDLFYLFCNDLIDSSRCIDESNGYDYIIDRFDKWKGFGGSNRKYLSENEIRGLLGELIFLSEKLFDKYGTLTSIMGWTGPEPTKKDFSYQDTWYEVKTASKDVATITSIEQLDSDKVGFLVIYFLEKLSPESNDITINKIIDKIFNQISKEEEKSQFIIKLVQAGFYREEYYDTFVYRVIKNDIFEVNEYFPRLKRKDLPNAISDVKYDLYVNMLDVFRRDVI